MPLGNATNTCRWREVWSTDYYRILVDRSGVYAPVAEVADEDEDKNVFVLFRFDLDSFFAKRDDASIVAVGGMVIWPNGEEYFHAEWFSGSLGSVADSIGCDVIDLQEAFCQNESLPRLFWAYESVAGYHGWENFDSYPIELTEFQLDMRWSSPFTKEEALLRLARAGLYYTNEANRWRDYADQMPNWEEGEAGSGNQKYVAHCRNASALARWNAALCGARLRKLERGEDTRLHWKAGDILTVSGHHSAPCCGLSYSDMTVVAAEDGSSGGWDVFDGIAAEVEDETAAVIGGEASFYGFSVVAVEEKEEEYESDD